MLSNRERQSLDNYITGHYGEDQFGDDVGVYELDDLWYWDDEEGSFHGPYNTQQGAQADFALYCAEY